MPGNRNTSRKAQRITAIVAFTIIGGGCAISDYRGYLNHATSDNRTEGNGYRITQFDPGGRQNGIVGESKLWGKEVSVISSFPGESGTYTYTAEYDFRGQRNLAFPGGTYPSPILLTTYRNQVVGAFNADGSVDRDGDDIRKNAGSTGGFHDPADPSGIWHRRFLFVDRNVGCQFFANFEQAFVLDKPSNAVEPTAALCLNDPIEEVDDRDVSLLCEPPQADPNPGTPSCNAFNPLNQDAFGSLDDLFKKIWSGAIGALAAGDGGFTIEATSITVNGTRVELSTAAVIDVQANTVRPVNVTVDLTSAGGQELLKALLTNTEHMQRTSLSAGFLGGMSLDLPAGMIVAFDHDKLRSLLND